MTDPSIPDTQILKYLYRWGAMKVWRGEKRELTMLD